MLIGLAIRDVVLIETLDLSIGPGLTALTGETGAGKSIILDALGLAVGARADAGLVRRGASQAQATAIFAPPRDHPVWAYLGEKGLGGASDEDLVLRRQLSADGRSRAFVNDQATSVGTLRDLGAMLLEVHGQHETVGLLDARNHRPLLDAFGSLQSETAACVATWSAWRASREKVESLRAPGRTGGRPDIEELTLRLGELDRLDPREGRGDRAGPGTGGAGRLGKNPGRHRRRPRQFRLGLSSRLAQAFRALERARERAVQAGVDPDSAAGRMIEAAAAAVDRTQAEAQEAVAAIDAAARAFDFEPNQLENTEERLFALRAMARKLGVPVDDLPATRVRFAQALRATETSQESLKAAEAEAVAARGAYLKAAEALSAGRRAAGERLAKAVGAELGPLKLDKARFRVAVEAVDETRMGPSGADRIEFEIATNPGAPFGGLGAIASGGELARFALALKASLAGRGEQTQPLMIFDEVDQGVGGAVADAVGLRLKRLASVAQVLVVTHSPQVAARADAHWRVAKSGDGETLRTAVETLGAAAREEEIARMLSGAEITEAARAAARALMHA